MVNPSFLFEVNMHGEVLQEVDHLKILNEADSIKVALDKGWSNMPDQVGLQGHKPDLNPLTEYENSCGRGHRMQYPENYFKYDLWDIPIVNSIMAKYGMIRTRLMASKPKTCLTIHADMSKRIHIPLMSNPECLMVIEDRAYYLEPGKVYLTNTTLRHTALNGSQTNRLHIVGCIYS